MVLSWSHSQSEAHSSPFIKEATQWPNHGASQSEEHRGLFVKEAIHWSCHEAIVSLRHTVVSLLRKLHTGLVMEPESVCGTYWSLYRGSYTLALPRRRHEINVPRIQYQPYLNLPHGMQGRPVVSMRRGWPVTDSLIVCKVHATVNQTSHPGKMSYFNFLTITTFTTFFHCSFLTQIIKRHENDIQGAGHLIHYLQ